MEHIEIVLKDIKLNRLENVFYENIIFNEKDVMSSHFFTKGKDVEYQNIRSLKEYFQTPGTCNIYLKKITMGTVLENVLILIVCDGTYADITVNFGEECLEVCDVQKNAVRLLLELLVQISKEGDVGKIVVGYEPAEDDDMKILEINQGQIKRFQMKDSV